MDIILEASGSAAKAVALKAGQVKAKVCLSGCPFCLGIVVTASQKWCEGKTTVDECKVRINCHFFQKDLIRPPQGELTPEACPVRLRSEKAALNKVA